MNLFGQYQPNLRFNGWRYTIKEQRLAVSEVLEENPSLRSELPETQHKAYQFARLATAEETGLSEQTFPVTRPFSFGQMMFLQSSLARGFSSPLRRGRLERLRNH
jgi:hypothetical protein